MNGLRDENGAAAAEAQRLRAVYSTWLLDTAPEKEFDELAELAATICDTPIGLMSLIDERRQWFKASIGVELQETPREISFCDHAIRQPELFVVEDAREDARFANNPLVTSGPHIQFYAGMPLITADGCALGTLCVADTRPRHLTEEQRRAIAILAGQVVARIELRAQKRAAEEAVRQKAQLAAELEEYQEQLEQANDRLRKLVVTDALTGLRNRRAFEERLTFEFSMARRKHRELAVVLMDVDDFKDVNDRFGHPAGDAVLKRLARVLQETLRVTDLAARYGGEEFAVLLPESDERMALDWCRRFQRELSSVLWDHRPITLSMGAAGRIAGCESPSEMVALADQALYRAKALGKDRAVGSRDLLSGPQLVSPALGALLR